MIRHMLAAALIAAPAAATAQDAAKLGQKQKSWMISNFRSGLDCSSVSDGAFSFSGQASFDAGSNGGIDISVSSDAAGLPTVTAVAINTKGTGADKNRTAPSSCPSASSSGGKSMMSCSVSGDPQSPVVRATVPLSALSSLAGSRYVGTVTIVKRSEPPGIGGWGSKKGYDYYQAQNGMTASVSAHSALTFIGPCDASGITAKGSKPSTVSYDLAVGKKA